jgi:opacity protein-like surface antigen
MKAKFLAALVAATMASGAYAADCCKEGAECCKEHKECCKHEPKPKGSHHHQHHQH